MKINFKQLIVSSLVIVNLSNTYAFNENDVHTFEATHKCLGCDLEGYTIATFGGSELDDVDLSGSNLKHTLLHASFKNGFFSHTNLSDANLDVALNLPNMYSAPATGHTLFNHAKLSNTTLLGHMRNVDFSYSSLDSLNVRINNDDYDLKKHWPTAVRLPLIVEGSSFVGVSFKNANLFNAIFRESDFTDADFTGANLRGASFESSNITLDQIQVASDVCEVDLPNGDYIIGRNQPDGSVKLCEGFITASSKSLKSRKGRPITL